MLSVKDSPKYSTHREAVTAVDASPSTKQAEGINYQGYDYALFQVIPTGGANPSIELMEWSDEANSFISANPKFELTGLGIDTPYSFTSLALGRILWVRVSALLAGSVNIVYSGKMSGI